MYPLAHRSRFEENRPPRARKSKESHLYLRMVELALRRPRAIPHLLRAAWAFRARHWYRRPPFLPLPPRSYLRWRLDTAYGDPDAVPPPDDFVRYLAWGTEMRRRMSRRA